MSASLTCLASAIWLCSTSGLQAENGIQAPFPDLASPEIWVDGPDAVQVGTLRLDNDVAVDNEGRRIHVWEAGEPGTENGDIYLRRWGADGSPLEDPKMVNTTTDDLQNNPRVAVSADGSFLVVFGSTEPVAAQSGAPRLLARSQAYDANGDPIGTEQLLTAIPPTSLFVTSADVAALRTTDGSHGGYIVVWKSNTSPGTDPGFSIQGCLVDANGLPGAQFQVNSGDLGFENFPSVTELSDGGFLAVWTIGLGNEVRGRRFNSAAGPIGDDFNISSAFDATKFETDVAIGWNGTVAVVWADNDELLGFFANEIRMRLYDSDLVALGPDFRVNTLDEFDQRMPRVADFGPIGFLVVWESEMASGDDQGDSIEARVVSGPNAFDADGDGVDDDQVQYNTWDDNKVQQLPSSHGWYGRLATDWMSPSWDGDPSPADPDTAVAVVSRNIEYCLFCDDFEWFSPASSGSLWRWTSSTGVAP